MLGLSDDDIRRICKCVSLYLDGGVEIEDEIVRRGVDEGRYIKEDMLDVASGRYSIHEIKNFLCTHDGRGLYLARVHRKFFISSIEYLPLTTSTISSSMYLPSSTLLLTISSSISTLPSLSLIHI